MCDHSDTVTSGMSHSASTTNSAQAISVNLCPFISSFWLKNRRQLLLLGKSGDIRVRMIPKGA